MKRLLKGLQFIVVLAFLTLISLSAKADNSCNKVKIEEASSSNAAQHILFILDTITKLLKSKINIDEADYISVILELQLKHLCFAIGEIGSSETIHDSKDGFRSSILSESLAIQIKERIILLQETLEELDALDHNAYKSNALDDINDIARSLLESLELEFILQNPNSRH